MTTTPTLWWPTRIVNSGATAGVQSDPFAVETADGRILTLWVDDTNNVDTAAGTDIVGRHFDYYQGAAAPFHVNLNVFAGHEDRPRAAALPDGGFFTVYHSNDNGNDVYYIRHDAAGNVVSSGAIAQGGNNYSSPSIALLGDNTLVVGYTSEGTAENYGVATFDLATNTVVARRTFDDPVGPNAGGFNIEVAALGGDRFVAVYEAELVPVLPPFNILELRGRVYDASGLVTSFELPDTENASGMQVAGLFGGGFVVAYQPFHESEIHARFYDSGGSAIGGAIDLGLPDGPFESRLHDVVGLKEGGFFVVFDNGATGALSGQRYASNGAPVGAPASLFNGGADRARLALTQDGRIIVSWNNGGDIRQQILDPRDEGLAIVGTEVDEILTARVEGSWVLGGGGNDRLFGRSGADRLEGGIGADILMGSSGNDILDGGLHQDRVEGGFGSDTYILGRPGVTIGGEAAIVDILVETPGAGADTVEVEFHDIPIGGGFAFFFETYTLPENFENGIVRGHDFFQLIGNGLNNRLQGNGAANWLDGGDGNDVLIGGLGDDRLTGGAGNDTADFSAAGPVTVDLKLTGAQNTGEGLDTFSGVENLIGSASGDILAGDVLNNRIDGGGGDDKLSGHAAHDILIGGAGNDVIYGDAGNDIIDGGAGLDRLYDGATNDVVFGGADADQLFAGPAIDRLDGGDGNDRLYAHTASADTFVFASAVGIDRVFKFLTGTHNLEIDASVYGGAAGSFTFRANANPVAPSAARTLLYDTDDGKLWFDADGNGAGARVHVLTLLDAPTLAAGDILLV